jgi:two-component system sensor histidine kinase KdpD
MSGRGSVLDAAIRHRITEVLAGRDVPAGRLAERTTEQILPLRVSLQTLGVLVVLPPANAVPIADSVTSGLLNAFAGQIALAFERARLAREAQKAQLDVLEQERLRNALLSSVSHDLRAPLAVVKGAATALLDGGDSLSPERRFEYLRTISQESSRLNRLLGNLIDMTSLEAGMLTACKDCVPSEEVIGAALGRLEESLGERRVEVRIAPEATMVSVDPVLFPQVLVNLVENAIKYAPGDSAIEIEARSTNGAVEIEVADRGPGIAAGEEQRIFEKFQRASTSTGGMGLGLTICRGIVAVHGGTIQCANRPGGGARFLVALPCSCDGSERKCGACTSSLEGSSQPDRPVDGAAIGAQLVEAG